MTACPTCSRPLTLAGKPERPCLRCKPCGWTLMASRRGSLSQLAVEAYRGTPEAPAPEVEPARSTAPAAAAADSDAGAGIW